MSGGTNESPNDWLSYKTGVLSSSLEYSFRTNFLFHWISVKIWHTSRFNEEASNTATQ